MQTLTLLQGQQFEIMIKRLCYQLIENHNDFSESVILGLQPRGAFLSQRIVQELKKIIPDAEIGHGVLDVTFFRDDFRKREANFVPNSTSIDFLIEKKKVIIVDDVLWTGRTIRAGLDAMLAFGRPDSVELLVLVNRRFARQLPIEATYIGLDVDSIDSQKIRVLWHDNGEMDKVVLLSNKE